MRTGYFCHTCQNTETEWHLKGKERNRVRERLGKKARPSRIAPSLSCQWAVTLVVAANCLMLRSHCRLLVAYFLSFSYHTNMNIWLLIHSLTKESKLTPTNGTWLWSMITWDKFWSAPLVAPICCLCCCLVDKPLTLPSPLLSWLNLRPTGMALSLLFVVLLWLLCIFPVLVILRQGDVCKYIHKGTKAMAMTMTTKQHHLGFVMVMTKIP